MLMKVLKKAEDYFITGCPTSNTYLHYRYKLLFHASVFTSLFSLLYLGVSILIDFQLGIYFMLFNVAGFLLLPFLMKTRIPITILGNLYVFTGTLAVTVLTWYSGGIYSPVFPWLIAPPLLALLLINRLFAFLWTGIVLICLAGMIIMVMTGATFPVRYDTAWQTVFILMSSSGIILIIVLIAMIFESNTIRALKSLEKRKKELELSKEELAAQHEEILEKNNILTLQKEELQTTSEQLKELNNKKDYLMEIIAHDLKSPMATIQALIGLIKIDEKTNPDDRQIIDLILDSAIKSQALIRKILSTENLEKVSYDLNMEVTDLAPILKQVIATNRETANKKRITLSLLADNGAAYPALVDSVYLIQVYENILGNAIKFSPFSKQITISLKAVDGVIRTEIKDEGPGIRENEMPLLFEKFKRLSNKPTGGETSSGLGLSIARHYTQLLNGKIWCESKPGRGANFIIEFPAYHEPN